LFFDAFAASSIERSIFVFASVTARGAVRKEKEKGKKITRRLIRPWRLALPSFQFN
jgi:hypothetical protein